MLSGGSVASWSVTFDAWTLTVQVSFAAKFAVGSRVKVVGPPLAVAGCAPVVPQEMAYQLLVTFTGSLNVIVTLESRATPVVPGAGIDELTVGAASPMMLLRGLGVAAAKSALLLSVSMRPSSRRKAARVELKVGAAPAPSKKFALP